MTHQAEDGVGQEETVNGCIPLVFGENEVDSCIDQKSNDEDDES
jgi:hypothetical protein